MPVCTNCAAYVECVYTQYSINNFRLEQCRTCSKTADEYVQKDHFSLALDLILLKSVLLHLLYNRGTKPRIIGSNGTIILPNVDTERDISEKRRRITIFRVGTLFVVLDSIIRWCHTHPLPSDQSGIETFLSKQTIRSFAQTLLSCVIESTLFHAGIIIASTVGLSIFRVFRRDAVPSGVEREFRLSHISLALLYASLTKLFLLSLLVIWKPAATGISTKEPTNDGLEAIFHIFDDNRLNREWLLRNLMGGMASGFAVRVVLNGRPLVAAFIVIFAWSMKAAAAYMLSRQIPSTSIDRDWLIFSMP